MKTAEEYLPEELEKYKQKQVLIDMMRGDEELGLYDEMETLKAGCGLLTKTKIEMKILIACEESQEVCRAFRELGFEAYSCDLQECSGGKPEWHIVGDAVKEAYSGKYDMMIAHPPCTYMSRAGARWMYPTAGNLCQDRYEKAMEAKAMFLKLLNAPIEYIAVENPTPLKVVELPKHSQAIQPYEYGHEFSKRTLLWLKNLPLLKPTDIKSNFKPYLPSNTGGKKRGQKYQFVNISQKESSKTFSGVAKALAFQYGNFIKSGIKIKDWNNLPISEIKRLMSKDKNIKITQGQPDCYTLLGTVVSFPENNEMIMFQDFRWWKGIPSNVNFQIESIANKSADEFWLVADGYGNILKPNSYGNGKIAVNRKYILEALSLQ